MSEYLPHVVPHSVRMKSIQLTRYDNAMFNLADMQWSHQSVTRQRFLSDLWMPLHWKTLENSIQSTYSTYNMKSWFSLEKWIKDGIRKGHLTQSWLNGNVPWTEQYFESTIGSLLQIGDLFINGWNSNVAILDSSAKDFYIVDGSIKYRGYGYKMNPDKYGDKKDMVRDYGMITAYALYGAKLTHDSVDMQFVDYLPKTLPIRDAVDLNPKYRPSFEEFYNSLNELRQSYIERNQKVSFQVNDATLLRNADKELNDEAERQRWESLNLKKDDDHDADYDLPDSKSEVLDSSTLEPEPQSNEQQEKPRMDGVDDASHLRSAEHDYVKQNDTGYTMELKGCSGSFELDDIRLEKMQEEEYQETKEDTGMFEFDMKANSSHDEANADRASNVDITNDILALDLDLNQMGHDSEGDNCSIMDEMVRFDVRFTF